MKNLAILAALAAFAGNLGAASAAQPPSEEQVRAVIAPWYHTGKSFRIMAIDIQTIKDGKIAKTFHMENWLSALGQLRAK
jgi:hypothetical protein